MAKKGDVIENPATGERMAFRQTAKESSGELLQFDFFLKPHAAVPVEHAHPIQQERYEVLAGTLWAKVNGGEIRRYQPGEVLMLPPGTRHILWNAGEVETHTLVEFTPALDIETFFETMAGLARDGKTNQKGAPNLWQLAVILRNYHRELYLPPPVRVIFTLFASIGKVLGYKARYPKYSQD